MNRTLGMGRPLYRCAKCGREVFPTRDGYMPRHRPPKKRSLCDGAGDPTLLHKKVQK